MKKLVRRHSGKILIRRNPYRRRIGMLHPPAAGSLSNVQNENVTFERSAVHKLDFVLANPLQILLDLLPPPPISMDHHRHARSNVRQVKLLKFAEFHGPIGQRIVALTGDGDQTVPTALRDAPLRCRLKPPVQWSVPERHVDRFGPAIRHIKENHCRIDESVLPVQLRRKRPNLIPIGCVANGDRSLASNPPSLFVHFFNRRFPCSLECFHSLNMAAEIPNLIQSIPRGHLDRHLAGYVRNGHGYMEKVPLRIADRHFVPNRRPASASPAQRAHQKRHRREHGPAPPRLSFHLVLASEETCTGWPSLASSFSQSPSKLPLDITRSTSPGSASS